MPTTAEHLKKAKGNEAFAASIKASDPASIDWRLIALFYSAMHYVEAYLAGLNVHLRSHMARDRYVAREPNLKRVRLSYSYLKFYGYNARYEMDSFTLHDVEEATGHLAQLKAEIVPLI